MTFCDGVLYDSILKELQIVLVEKSLNSRDRDIGSQVKSYS